jgi:hypothetical protein
MYVNLFSWWLDIPSTVIHERICPEPLAQKTPLLYRGRWQKCQNFGLLTNVGLRPYNFETKFEMHKTSNTRNSLIQQSVSRQVQSLFQSEFHIVRSRVSSFRCEYPLPSLMLFSSFLRLLPRLPVTSIPPFIFPSVTCRRRQFLRKVWPIQLVFRLLISCIIFLCFLTLLLRFSHYRSNWSQSFSSTTFPNFPGVCPSFKTYSEYLPVKSHFDFGQLMDDWWRLKQTEILRGK